MFFWGLFVCCSVVVVCVGFLIICLGDFCGFFVLVGFLFVFCSIGASRVPHIL